MGRGLRRTDPKWQRQFDAEACAFQSGFGSTVLAIHHIGSTAIAGMLAKPIIDVLVGVTSLEHVDELSHVATGLGYEALGEYGIVGRRYFRKWPKGDAERVHVHMFADGSIEINRHLAFRDYLRAHPRIAQAYSDLKRCLDEEAPEDDHAYQDGKRAFIDAIQVVAMAWQLSEAECHESCNSHRRGRIEIEQSSLPDPPGRPRGNR